MSPARTHAAYARARSIAVALGTASLVAAACTIPDVQPKGGSGGARDAGSREPDDDPPRPTPRKDGGPDATASTPTLEDLEAYSEALCAKYEKCLPSVLFGTGLGAECRTSVLERTQKAIGARGDGTSSAGLAACVAKFSTDSCADDFNTPECRFVGALANDEPCLFHSQCASAACTYAAAPSCGRCITPTPANGACTGSECAAGTLCVANTCVRPARSSESCAAAPCATGLRCVNQTCVPLLGENARCTSSAECDSTKGLACVQTAGVNACKPWLTARIGETCNERDTTSPLKYCVQSYCGPDNVCLARIGLGKTIPAGASCQFGLTPKDGVCIDAYPAQCL